MGIVVVVSIFSIIIIVNNVNYVILFRIINSTTLINVGLF